MKQQDTLSKTLTGKEAETLMKNIIDLMDSEDTVCIVFASPPETEKILESK